MIKKTIYVTKKQKESVKEVENKINKKLGTKIIYDFNEYESIKKNRKIILNAKDSKGINYEIVIKRYNYWLILLLLLLLFAGAGFWYLNNNKNKVIIPEEVISKAEDINNITDDELIKRMQKSVDEGYQNLQINRKMIFKSSSEEGTIKIINVEKNPNDIDVTIKEKGTNEVLYRSGKIKPGQYIKKGKLEKELAKGTYNGYADIKIMDKQGKVINNPTVEVEIIIEN